MNVHDGERRTGDEDTGRASEEDRARAGDEDTRVDRPKAVLICPECGYEAPVDTGWSVEERWGLGQSPTADCRSRTYDTSTAARTDVRCPVCRQVVVSQPAFGVPAQDGSVRPG